jgi:hypothetical protein
MRIVLGGRLFVSPVLHVQLLAGLSPSARPTITVDSPLHAIEPRVWLACGIGGSFGGEPAAGTVAPVLAPVPISMPPALPAPAAPVYTLRGRVFDGQSQLPVADATIEIPGHASTVSGSDGAFAIDAVPQSADELSVRAQGFRDFSLPISIDKHGGGEPLEIVLARELPDPQIRGTVRSYRGTPVAGLVHVQPGGLVRTLGAEGTFEIDVAPGEYTVLITARGYVSQEQRVRVEQGDVTVIAVELKAER